MVENQKDNNGKIKNQVETVDSSRRKFLKNTGIVTGGAVGGLILGGLLGNPFKVEETAPVTPDSEPIRTVPTEAMQFFTRKEDFDTVAAASEVIFPADENGPGAIGLGVPYYIDKQLASPWGRNADDYMKSPFRASESRMNRGDIMLLGLRKMNEVSQSEQQDNFKNLDEEIQIEILTRFEVGEIDLNVISSTTFFSLLRQLTIEGCYADPMYGGNKNMEGWKMKEFPGAHMSNLDVVELDEFVYKEPLSLSDHM